MADTTLRPRRWRWLGCGLLLLLVLLTGPVLAKWALLSREAARGKEELASALAEADEVDPRWRWEHIEKDRPHVPEAENGIRIVFEVEKALRGKPPIQAPDPRDRIHILVDISWLHNPMSCNKNSQ